jgi:transposase
MKQYSGPDVHKDSGFMCILNESGVVKEQKFSTLSSDLYELRSQLELYDVFQVAMESTGIYRIPIWRILSDGFDLKLVNPLFIKQLPGRKTDIRDAHWIGLVLMKGLVYGSYVPNQQIQTLRQYERRYSALNKRIVHTEQCIDMQLERCNIRFSNYISDKGSQAMRKVVRCIVDGITDPDELLKCAHTRTKNKHGRDVIRESLSGVASQVDQDMPALYRQEWQLYRNQQEECLRKMMEICNESYSREIALLTTVPGIKPQSAMTILPESGKDLSSFKTSSNPVGRAGLRARNDESAGKIKSRKIMHGNKFLRVILEQCAWANTRSKSSRSGNKYALPVKRMAPQKALVAIARKLSVIIWNVLTYKEPYRA